MTEEVHHLFWVFADIILLDSNRSSAPLEQSHELLVNEQDHNAVNGFVPNLDYNVEDGMDDDDNNAENPDIAENETDEVMIIQQETAELLFLEDENDWENTNGNENEIEIANNDMIVIIELPVFDRDHSIVQTTPVDCEMPDD